MKYMVVLSLALLGMQGSVFAGKRCASDVKCDEVAMPCKKACTEVTKSVSLKIGLCNPQEVVLNSNEYKERAAVLEKEAKKAQTEYAEKQSKFEEEYKTLMEEKKGEKKELTPLEQKNLQEKYMKLQEEQKRLEEKFQGQATAIQQEFEAKILAATEVVRVENNMDIVFVKQAALAGGEDITEDVIEHLNKKYSAEKRAKKIKKD